MNDRELLELAAKAAAIEILRSRLDDPLWRDMLLSPKHSKTPGIAEGWNPLTDDGDALRLAVSAPTIIDLQWIIAEAWQAHDEFDARMAYVRRAIVEKIAFPFARTTDTGEKS
ncbi:hypothetical protein [Burkholderia glumae]|uniref:hypothetical protein n=1 Tax=Burkholderia glumae TaxID=337 RepID=UPI003B9CA90E